MEKFYEQFLKRERPSGMIFDVDGTLLDSMPVWAHSGERYLATIGVHAPESLGRILFSMTMQQGAQYMKHTFGLPQTAEEIRMGIIQVVEAAYRTETGCKAGVYDFLKALHTADVPMIIVTSNERTLVEAAFERLAIRMYFKEILTCGEFGSGKDQPAIFQAAAARIGSDPEGTWVVEDGLYAIRTAKAAGMRTIGVADASSKKDEEQIRIEADYFITGFNQTES